MRVSSINDVKVYAVNTSKTLPEWITDKKKRKLLKSDPELRGRVNLIQDFEFPTAATNINITEDGNYILATGVYKPRINCYETDQLSLKFSRHLSADVVKLCMLVEDYRKLALLGSDRTIEVHAAYGSHYKTRIPRFGRDLCYNFENCDLFSVASGPEIYRLNLDEGIFKQPYKGSSPEFNNCTLNQLYSFLAAGGTDGFVELWDPRTADQCGRLLVNEFYEISSLNFHINGLQMAVGTSVGKVFLYDIRSRIPLLIKEHPYEFPIKKIIFHYHSRNIVSADKKVIKFWNEVSGNSFTSVEQEADLNDFCIPGSSGLILTANETPKMNVFYIPDLGSAPKWCHHLDGITEELEENYTNSIYEDYKFIERSELAQLGLESLIGSNHLRPYMHGFFINKRLYREVYSATQPFLYEQYRKAQIEKKLQEKRENRIGVVKKLPKVNKKLALKLLESRDRSSEKPPKSELLHDERFKSLWNDADFEIDVESEDYKLRHRRRDAIKVEEQFQPESFSSSEILEDDEINLRIPKMYELKDGVKFTEDIVQLESIASKLKLQEAPLGIRAQAEEEETTTLAPIRNRVITIQPQKSKEVLAREKAQKEHLKERKELRRSVKDLNLPKLKIGRKFYSKRK